MELPAEFARKLATAHMVFEPPRDAIPVPFTENGAVRYDHAVALSPDVEIRYQIVASSDLGMPLTEQQSRTMLISVATNIADQMLSGPHMFDAQAVRAEFGADRGCVCRLLLKPGTFAANYRECMLVALNREERGEAYIFFLYTDFDRSGPLIEQNYYTLRFAER